MVDSGPDVGGRGLVRVLGLWRRRPVLCWSVLLAVPFIVATASIARHAWYPVLDLAMTELRVRDVGTAHTPLVSLPGRIGRFPDQIGRAHV